MKLTATTPSRPRASSRKRPASSKPSKHRRSQVDERHGNAPVEPAPPSPDIDRRYLVEPPVDALVAWNQLGAELASNPHRLALAERVARAATSGGGKLTSHEEDELCALFGRIFDLGVERTGGIRVDRLGGQSNGYARAVWYLLNAGDWIRHPREVQPPRCPAMADMKRCPDEIDFCTALQAAVPRYLRTVIAGASDAAIEELCKLLVADDTSLEVYRPWGQTFTADTHPAESLESAISELTRACPTSESICAGVEGWANAYRLLVVEHDIPPVARIGACVWLAKVALADGGAL